MKVNNISWNSMRIKYCLKILMVAILYYKSEVCYGELGDLESFPEIARKKLVQHEENSNSIKIIYREEIKHINNNADNRDVIQNMYTVRIEEKRLYIKTEYSDGSVFEGSYDGEYYYYASTEKDAKQDHMPIIKKYNPRLESDPEITTPIYYEYLELTGLRLPQTIEGTKHYEGPESLVLSLIRNNKITDWKIENNYVKINAGADSLWNNEEQSIDTKYIKKQLEGTLANGEQIEQVVGSIVSTQLQNPLHRIYLELDSNANYGISKRVDYNIDGKRLQDINVKKWMHASNLDIYIPKIVEQKLYTKRRNMERVYETPNMIIEYTLHSIDRINDEFNYTLESSPQYRRAGTLLADRTTSAAKKSPYHQVNKFINVDGEYLTKNVTLDDFKRSAKVEVWHMLVIISIITSYIIMNRLWREQK